LAKIRFVSRAFREATLLLINTCNEIIATYSAQGYTLTLRQLFYQLVSRNIVPNTERSYKNVGNAVSDGRLAGLIDWDAIEDRVRVPRRASEFRNLRELAEAAISSYRLPRWDGQDMYAELWVEKDALAGVLEPIAREWHAVLMVNRGYSSQSAMFEASRRFRRAERAGMKPVLLYLGDHDPSGEDMVRDVADRLAMFGVEVDVRKIALTMAQVEEYNPPPNPAKMTDSRAAAYVELHGAQSWEVDALPPNVLVELINTAFAEIVDVETMDAIKEREEADKVRLLEAVEGIMRGGAE